MFIVLLAVFNCRSVWSIAYRSNEIQVCAYAYAYAHVHEYGAVSWVQLARTQCNSKS